MTPSGASHSLQRHWAQSQLGNGTAACTAQPSTGDRRAGWYLINNR